MTINIPLPDYHPGQQAMLDGKRRFNVACMGRRFGKTFFGLEQLLFEPGGAVDGLPVAWFAPTYKLLLDVWKTAVTTCEGITKAANKTEMRLELVTGGVVDFWTLEDDKAGRGRKYARIVIDEAAHARYLEDVWQMAILPTLSDYQGEAWFISTPNGQNYFHQLYKKAEVDPDTWASFQMPTSINPYIEDSEIEEHRRNLPELIFRQEYLAEFIDLAGNLIKAEWITEGRPPAGLRVVMGVDLAISTKDGADFTAVVVMGRDASGVIWIIDAERTRATFNEVLLFIKRMAARHNPFSIAIEQVQYQAAVVQELLRTTTLPVRGIRPDKDKLTRFMGLATRYEQGLVRHADTLSLDFERELKTFPVGEHDDLVDAASYAFVALGDMAPPTLVSSNRRDTDGMFRGY